MNALKKSFRNILHYPSALMGILVVLLLVFTAIYAMVKIPYQEAIHLWRGGEEIWYQNPKFAPPAWINLFSSKKYSESFAVKTSDGSMEKTVTQESPEIATIMMSYPFDFTYDVYPQEMILYITSQYQEKQPFISIEWITPDERTIRINNLSITGKETYRFSQDEKLMGRLKTEDVIPVLFSLPDSDVPLKGRYQLQITGTTFEPDDNIDVEFVFHGQVYGSGRHGPGAPGFDRAAAVGRAGGPGVWLAGFYGYLSADDDHCSHWHVVWRFCR